jgi:hypothetical protein
MHTLNLGENGMEAGIYLLTLHFKGHTRELLRTIKLVKGD